ncbi:P-loop containing nucleoside triphosphate hydrolase protein, partial [Sordaria brevicollis]
MSAPTNSTQAKTLSAWPSAHIAQHLPAIMCTSPATLQGPYIGGCKVPGSKDAIVVDENLSSDVHVSLETIYPRNKTKWQGFTLSFAYGPRPDIEDAGFGVCYRPTVDNTDMAQLELSSRYTIVAKLPTNTDLYTINKEDYTGNHELPEKIRNLPAVTKVSVVLVDGCELSVEGFGMPFANPGHPSEDWIHHNKPIVGDVDLLSLLRSRAFTFLTAKPKKSVQFGNLQPWSFRYPFAYPSSRPQSFDIEWFGNEIESNKGAQFSPLYRFDDDEQSVCCDSLAQVMDIWYLHKAASEIKQTKVHAYFVSTGSEATSSSYAIIRLTETFRELYKSQWRRLTKDGRVSIHLLDVNGVDSPNPQGKLVRRPYTIPVLDRNKHAFQDQFEWDIVIEVRLSDDYTDTLKTFEGRIQAEEAFKNTVTVDFNVHLGDLQRKVAAVEAFLPGSDPCPSIEVLEDCRPELEFRMALHRNLMRGTGLYSTLTQGPSRQSIVQAMDALALDEARLPRSIPSFDFFEIDDPVLKDAILMETLAHDKARMERYGSNCQYNIALVAAPGGTGKTTALSTLTLGGLKSSRGGKVFGSGPTNAAVTNFALRVHERAFAVTERCNKATPTSSTATPRYRIPLVVRGYGQKFEVAAFDHILKTGVADDTAHKPLNPADPPRWRLALSPSNWLLAVLGSKFLEENKEAGIVKNLLPEHASALHELKDEIDKLCVNDTAVARIVQRIRGELSWDDYRSGTSVPRNIIPGWLERIIGIADVVMTTPAAAQKPWFSKSWATAKIIAIDEAGCMHKADLCSIWGNTLRPAILAGDVKQLPPAMMELGKQDANDNFLNRFGNSGHISALAWLQAAGIPTFRLLQQLRMCQGMFDLANEQFYKDYPKMRYGDWCKASNASHAVGVALEKFIAGLNLRQALTRSPEDSLLPVFWHMPGTKVQQVETSKLNRMQVKGALDLLSDFVKSSPGVSPEDFVVIAAQAPNVEYGNRILKSYVALKGMPPVQTADSFQGREGSIAVVITGTRENLSAGFVSNANRLNVMLTRHKSGLVVIGDKNVTGKLEGTAKELARLDKQAIKGRAQAKYNTSGEAVFSKVKPLREVLKTLHKWGRIFEIVKGEEKKADKEAEIEAEKEDQELDAEERKLVEEANVREKELRAVENITESEELEMWGGMYD